MLRIRCLLLREVFEGGLPDDPRVAEWPPSWMRLFSALVSVAEPESPDDDLLRTLENASPPEVLAAEPLRSRRQAFVPTNRVPGVTGHTTLAGRTNSERAWARVAPRSPEVWYRWSSLDLDDADLGRLRNLCRKIPYLGRSTSPALVEVANEGPSDHPASWLQPADHAEEKGRFRFEVSVRSPFPGALDALRDAYAEKNEGRGPGDVWQVGRGVDYGHISPSSGEPVQEGPYETLILLRLVGRRLDGRHTARVAHATRRAVLARTDEALETLHGHHDGDTVQCAFLGLPTVGHQHADGHLLGLAVAVPNLTIEQLRVLADALPAADQRMEVTAGPLGVLELERIAPLEAQRHAWGLRPERWQGPARRWATATPLVLDRFLKKKDDVEVEVRRAAVNSRLPEPQIVRVSRRPLLHGAPDLQPRDTLRRPDDRAVKPYRHAIVEFPTPVRGPVVLGSMRHYGLGLCAPVRGEGDRDG